MLHFPKLVLLTTTLLMLCGFFWQKPTWESINRTIDRKFPSVQNINPIELKNELEGSNNIILIDVRDEDEYEVSHIPGALHFENSNNVTFSKNSPIVVYCSVGLRSAVFAKKLEHKGFLNVKNLRGSIFEWANRGFPLLRNGTTTTKVHPYNKAWGQLLKRELRN